MTWRLVWTDPAANDMRRLDQQVARRIRAALLRLAETGHGDVKKLSGEGEELRLRVGDWRVRFVFHHEIGAVEVLRVSHRREAYR